MSAALFLNPNLTTDQAIRLSKMQSDGFVSICDKFTESFERIQREQGPEEAMKFFNQMWPMIVQQMMLCF